MSRGKVNQLKTTKIHAYPSQYKKMNNISKSFTISS